MYSVIACIISSILLYFSIKKEALFCTIALSLPVCTIYNIYQYSYQDENALVGYAFAIMLFIANLYAIGANKKQEIILGSGYAGFVYMALFASDMRLLIIALELMMIISSIIIFIGGYEKSVQSAKMYFATHLVSGNMIIVGICYIMIKTHSTDIINLVPLLQDPSYSSAIIAMMLIGMLINVGCFPFSGWISNYYPEASPPGFVYLISYTSKVSVMILMKFFAGYEYLKIIGAVMLCYSAVKAILANNLFRIMSFLSIAQMGSLLMAMSLIREESNSSSIRIAIAGYLLLHILYKGLISISIASIADNMGSIDANSISKSDHFASRIGLIIGIGSMLTLPGSWIFTIKDYISNEFSASFLYFAFIFLSLMTVIAVPWRQYFTSIKITHANFNTCTSLSIYILCVMLLIASYFLDYIPLIARAEICIKSNSFLKKAIKHTIIIGIGFAFGFCAKYNRQSSAGLNIIESIGNFVAKAYNSYTQFNTSITKKSTRFCSAAQTVVGSWPNYVYNQQVAISIVFLFLIIMLCAMMYCAF